MQLFNLNQKDKTKLIHGILSLVIIGIIVAVGMIGITGCGQQEGLSTTTTSITTTSTSSTSTTLSTSTSTISTTSTTTTTLQLQLTRKLEVSGAYPNINFANDIFYISYENFGSVYVKTYDQNFNLTGEAQQLTSNEANDHQFVYGNNNFYLANSFYLRKYNSDLTELASVAVYANLPSDITGSMTDEEGLDDVLFDYINDSLYLGIPVTPSGKQNGGDASYAGGLYLQKYNQDLGLVTSITLESLGNTAATSMIKQNGNYLVVFSDDSNQEEASLAIAQYDANWNLTTLSTVSADSNITEQFPMGFLSHDDNYYISYNYISGEERTDIMLKVFDSNWNQIAEHLATADIPPSGGDPAANTAHLTVANDKVYLAYECNEEDTHKIIVKECQLTAD